MINFSNTGNMQDKMRMPDIMLKKKYYVTLFLQHWWVQWKENLIEKSISFFLMSVHLSIAWT